MFSILIVLVIMGSFPSHSPPLSTLAVFPLRIFKPCVFHVYSLFPVLFMHLASFYFLFLSLLFFSPCLSLPRFIFLSFSTIFSSLSNFFTLLFPLFPLITFLLLFVFFCPFLHLPLRQHSESFLGNNFTNRNDSIHDSMQLECIREEASG
jgi:hypothetical protein